MVSLEQLWLPILVAAVLVFVASSLIHMVFKWHASDYHGFSNEDAVRAAIRAGTPAPGQYMVPYCADMKQMKSPEMMAKYQEGPMAFVSLSAPRIPSMGAPLAQWFVLNLFVALISGYVACHAIAVPNPGGLSVARYVSSVTFMAYGVGSIANAIWMAKPWASTAKELLDAAIYAAVTAGAFAWLWPK